MKYFYEIIGIRVLCQLPFSLHIQEESVAFLHEAYENVDVDMQMIFREKEELPDREQGGHWEIDRYYIENAWEQRVYHCPSRKLPPYACVVWSERDPGVIYCDYLKGKEFYLNYSHNLCDLIGLETLLLSRDSLLLHASFIRFQGKGILFSAPSGTGKSTQADLWVKYENAEIINGDRAGMRRMEGGWEAFGLPVSGSSYIYRNDSAPVSAVIALRQGRKNNIRKLNPIEAMTFFYPETIVHQWDKCFTEKVVNLLLKLLEEVPVYLLECLPDEGAVRLVKETIMGTPKEGVW